MATRTPNRTPSEGPSLAEAAAFIRLILDHHKPRIDTDTGKGVRKYLLEAAASLDKAADRDVVKAANG